jgi:hypothetical protein
MLFLYVIMSSLPCFFYLFFIDGSDCIISINLLDRSTIQSLILSTDTIEFLVLVILTVGPAAESSVLL